jgi:hypothetical protein
VGAGGRGRATAAQKLGLSDDQAAVQGTRHQWSSDGWCLSTNGRGTIVVLADLALERDRDKWCVDEF